MSWVQARGPPVLTPRDDVSRLAAPKGPIGPYFLVKIGMGQNHQPLKWMGFAALEWHYSRMTICVHGKHLALNMENGAKDRNMGISLNKKNVMEISRLKVNREKKEALFKGAWTLKPCRARDAPRADDTYTVL